MRTLALLLLLVGVLSSPAAQAQSLPELGPAPRFELVDAGGATFQSEAMVGNTWVLSFFFTTCPGICPMIQGRIAELHALFSGVPDFKIVSISVDPGTDTAEKLAAYADSLKADRQRWTFLRGEIEAVRAIARNGLRLNPGETPDQHTTRVVLIDSQMQIRGFFQGTDSVEMARLRDSIKILLRN